MEGLISIFLLPALAGYLLLTISKLLSIYPRWNNASKLYLQSLITGLIVLYFSYTISFIYNHLKDIKELLHWKFGLKYIFYDIDLFYRATTFPITNEMKSHAGKLPGITPQATSVIPLSIVFIAIERILFKVFPSYFLNKVSDIRSKLGGPLFQLFTVSMLEMIPVQITLKNRKVYLALVLDLPQLIQETKHQKYMNIIPLKSGFRADDTLEIAPEMTNYDFLTYLYLDNLSKIDNGEDILVNVGGIPQLVNPIALSNAVTKGMAIDMEEIISAALWDPAIYSSFQANR